MRCVLFILTILCLTSGSLARAESPALYLCLGDDLDPDVANLIERRLRTVDANIKACSSEATDPLPHRTLVFGDHPLSRRLLDGQRIKTLPSEATWLKTLEVGANAYAFAIGKASGAAAKISLGSHYAAYELLERLGFRFLHPLEPFIPKSLHFPIALDRTEAPRWPVRRWHLHTQHPIELTNLLNGWGPDRPGDRAGFEAMLPEWDLFLEWCLANKQNQVTWFLLMAKSWQTFADSSERQDRLRILIQRAQAFGLKAGLVAPIAFRQQHAWTMIRSKGQETREIHAAIDWLAKTDLDIIEIEMGFSEFTHPNDQTMLDWMNDATRYAKDSYQIETTVKVHASTGQLAKNFKNPETGAPLNFNFLPYYADPDLGVMAHTVQFYGLTDPALTYGNQDFSAIYDYMRWEAGRRQVLFYPETAYWVSYDIDVPLFLPIYADRRLADLRYLARAEDSFSLGLGEHRGSRIQGQVNFSSGWEWGYWLNDVITARAAWNPLMEISDDRSAMATALLPLSSLFGELGPDLSTLLLDVIAMEKELLLLGRVDGHAPKSLDRRTGQAYLQGMDAWDDIAELVGKGTTQPAKKGLITMRHPLVDKISGSPSFKHEISPLLKAMSDQFLTLSNRMDGFSHRVPSEARPLYEELQDALRITQLRAAQVEALYRYVDEDIRILSNPEAKERHKAIATKSLDQALELSARRASHYRVPIDRIAAWKEGPTAYHYGYLWSVQNLVYWWRDEAKAIGGRRSPCLFNLVDPFDVAFGTLSPKNASFLPFPDGSLLESFPKPRIDAKFLGECLDKPSAEPRFPPAGLRDLQ